MSECVRACAQSKIAEREESMRDKGNWAGLGTKMSIVEIAGGR